MSTVLRINGATASRNSLLNCCLAAHSIMDSQTTLGLEGLNIGKTKAKRYHSQRGVNRAKGRRAVAATPQPYGGKKSDDHQTESQRERVTTLTETQSFANPDSIPSYTALNIPPLGSSSRNLNQSRVKAPQSPLWEPKEQPDVLQRPCTPLPQPLEAREPPTTPLLVNSNSTRQPQAKLKKPTPLAPPSVIHLPGLPGPRIDKLDRFIQAATLSSNSPGAPLPTSFGRPTGGVRPVPIPEPTSDYLSRASNIPTHLPEPQHLLIVLDLNGTLLIRSRGRKTYHPRPGLQPFLDYCLANHYLLIWSSATPGNVQGVCATLFTPAQRSLLLGEWGRDTFGLTHGQYRENVQVYKQLSWVWADEGIQAWHPLAEQGGRWDQGNTVLIDDSAVRDLSEHC